MNHPVWLIAKQEFTLNRRNRWVISFAVVFCLFTVMISLLGMVTSGYSGFQDFVRTAASIINLDGFLVPLFALLLSVFSFLSYREHLDLMVTQPVSRAQVILGKYIGLIMTIIGATILGFGLPGIIISFSIGLAGAVQYAVVVLLAFLLAVIFTGLAVLITLISQRQQIALGVSVGVWIFFELLYGLMMLGTTLHFSRATLKVLLLAGLMGNPVDLTRVLALLVVGGPHFFGPAGATLLKLTGSTLVASLIGIAGLVVWILLPLLISIRVFNRQNL